MPGGADGQERTSTGTDGSSDKTIRGVKTTGPTMPPKRVIDFALGCLMAAYRECEPFDANRTDFSVWMFTSTKYTQFGSTKSMRAAIRKLAEKCSRWLDQYPLQDLEGHLQSCVADVKEKAIDPATASSMLREKLITFFRAIEVPGEWEIVSAIYGVAANQPPFALGPCHFYIMDQPQYDKWKLRESSGRYEPPGGTVPISDRTGFGRELVGNWVAAVRVRASDHVHAKAKAQFRVEETLNLLRHGTFHFRHPQKCPRLGLGHPSHLNHSLICMRVDAPGHFSRSSQGGGEGVSTEICNMVRAWLPLQQLMMKEPVARTELETRVMTELVPCHS